MVTYLDGKLSGLPLSRDLRENRPLRLVTYDDDHAKRAVRMVVEPVETKTGRRVAPPMFVLFALSHLFDDIQRRTAITKRGVIAALEFLPTE